MKKVLLDLCYMENSGIWFEYMDESDIFIQAIKK